VNFYDLQQRHDNLVQESTTALQRQKREIERLGRQVYETVQQVARLHCMIGVLIDSLSEEDQRDLEGDAELDELHRYAERAIMPRRWAVIGAEGPARVGIIAAL
jgi:hypothetical protein